MDLLNLFDRIAAAPAKKAAKGELCRPAKADLAERELTPEVAGRILAPAKPQTLPEKIRLRRDERWQFCREVVTLTVTRNFSQEQAVSAVVASCPGRFQHIKPTYHNLRRWLAALGSYRNRAGKAEYNFDNIDALADEYAIGSQPKRFDEIIFKVFCGMYLSPRRVPFSVCYRETKKLFAREFREVRFPSSAQVRYRVQQLPQLLVDCGRYGIDYVQNHSLYMLIRDWSTVRPGQCWIADSRPFDQLIRSPKGTAVRPDVTYIMDAASWYCIGFDVTCESVDNDMIRNVFARGCVEHGRPEVLYVDNGADYNKMGFSHPVMIEGREYSIFKSLDIRLTNAQPYRGRSKTVERSFRDYSLDFDRRQPSYLGDSPANRPASAEMYYTPQGVELLPSIEQFCAMLRDELERYHNTPREGRFRGRTPREIWESSDRIQRAPLSDTEMHRALLLPLPKPRQVHRGGCVDINRIRYYSPALTPHTGGKVIIKTSYLEPGRVHAFDLKGNYLAECTAQSTTHPLANIYGDDDDRRILAEQLVIQGRQRQELLSQFSGATAGLAGLAVEEITSLTRADLESGKSRVTVLTKRKVKGGDHNLKLVTTAARAAEAKEQQAARNDRPALPAPAAAQPGRAEFDKEFSAMMAGEDTTNPKQENDYDEFTL